MFLLCFAALIKIPNIIVLKITKGFFSSKHLCASSHIYALMYTCSVVQPAQAAIRLRVEVTLEDAEAHSGLIVGLVCILLGVLMPGLGGVGVVFSAPAHYAIIVSRVHFTLQCTNLHVL